MDHFDLCIIGGGPSGYAAAMRAVDFKKKVLLIEKDQLGGAGIFNGALSSKTFWEISKEYASFSRKMMHYGLPMPLVKFSNILKEVTDAVQERSAQLEEHLTRVVEKTPDCFTYLQGWGKFAGPNEVEIESNGKKKRVKADHIIIATGSRPRKLTDIPVDESVIITSDGISSLREFPDSLVILGAGVIGCEFATIFSNFGRARVHLIARDQHILP
ncbi:MAG: FAD-dependent oxidoreductase, partial [SAR324 cluster bacterium]|nr:FAD-dependent oxidoreductase [SAR324 cluster bacterium]